MWDIFPFFLTTRQNVNTTTYQRNNVTTRQYATVSVSRHVKMPKTVRPSMLKWSFYNIFSGKLTVNKKSVRLSRQMSRVPRPEKFAQGELLTRADCHPCRLNKNIYVWIKKHTTIFAFTLHLSYLYSIKNIYSIVNKCTKNLKCICTHSLTSHKYCKDDILPWSL